MSVQKSIGERIRQLRHANGWTQADLANLADCSKQLVSDWEAGRSEITVSSVVVLARGVSGSIRVGFSSARAMPSHRDLPRSQSVIYRCCRPIISSIAA